jgi:hypothetical protein
VGVFGRLPGNAVIVRRSFLDGAVHWRTRLDIDGLPVEPLSLCVSERNRMLIGTTDGRIMDCSYSAEGAGNPSPSK